MDSKKIFKLLSNDGFKDPDTGNLFFPVYIYHYDVNEEHTVNKEIINLKEQLARPSHHLDNLHIHIWDDIMSFFKDKQFGKFTFLELIQRKESKGEDVTPWVRQHLFDEKNGYFVHLKNKIQTHFKEGDISLKPYILVNGFTEAYPYIRPGEFLKNVESYTTEFKLILFYPGEVQGETFYLFGELESENIYRANLLNQMIENAD
ncbi:MAG: hypothetical protein ACJATI_001025 [Halioglobus sp.]|jgi:hypothetical protein